MTVLFFLSVPGFREREYRVVFRIESDGGIEWYAFLPLEPLDESGGAGGEKLFQMGVGQFLVQNTAEHQQPAPVMVAPGQRTTLPKNCIRPVLHLGQVNALSCIAGKSRRRISSVALRV